VQVLPLSRDMHLLAAGCADDCCSGVQRVPPQQAPAVASAAAGRGCDNEPDTRRSRNRPTRMSCRGSSYDRNVSHPPLAV